MADDEAMAGMADEATSANGDDSTGEVVIGSAALRPVFLGNLVPNYSTDQVTSMFENPSQLRLEREFKSIPVDRIDVKRGYCFVFLKDAETQADKEQIEAFVVAINGIDVPNLSKGVRAEFARGDGRVKRKEDERRKNIAPSDTLFVVNFHEETTKKEDLEMLFEPFGELVRIDMKRNYAFVQFKTIAEATQAKETTNGGKLDQSVLTVEYVARQRESEIRSGGGGDRRGGGRGSRDGNRGGDRYDNHRRSDNDRRGGRPDRDYRGGDRGRSDNDRYSRGGGRRDNSPPPPAYRGGGGSRGGRSRSRSPPYGRSRSPPRRGYDDRYSDDYRRNNYRRGASPPDYHRRGPSPVGGSPPPPPRRGASSERYRGGDRERGYRG